MMAGGFLDGLVLDGDPDAAEPRALRIIYIYICSLHSLPKLNTLPRKPDQNPRVPVSFSPDLDICSRVKAGDFAAKAGE
jgi:hypothetical protein